MVTRVCERQGKVLLALAAGITLGGSHWVSAPGAQAPRVGVSGESSGWVVSLAAAQPCSDCPTGIAFTFQVRDKATGRVTGFRHANRTERVTEIRVVDVATAVVLGTAGESGIATVLNLPGGQSRDSFLCVWPALSPDNRFLAFRKWFPARFPPGVWFSDEYLVYDLTRGPDYNRRTLKGGARSGPGLAVYPPGAANAAGGDVVTGPAPSRAHSMASDGFFWLDSEDVLAFVDRYEGVNRVVIADLRHGARQASVAAHPLESSVLVDLTSCRGRVAPSDLERWSKDPAQLIYAKRIGVRPNAPRTVQVTLMPNPCLTNTTVDLPDTVHFGPTLR